MKFQKYAFRGKMEKTPGGIIMEGRIISKETMERFYQHLLNEEKSANTLEKYIRDAKAFMIFAAGAEITKELVIGYKQKLIEDGYAVRSVNSILASINSLFVFLGWYDCKVKSLKLQREIYCSEEKETEMTFTVNSVSFSIILDF